MDRRSRGFAAVAAVVVGLGAIAASRLSDAFPVEPQPAHPSAVPAATSEPQLAGFGWFELRENYQDESTLTGFALQAGTFDGVVTSTIVDAFPALTPASQLRGALPFARGPSAGIVLYGFTDATHSELHQLAISSGEDQLLVDTPEVIHDAAWDPRSNRATFIALRRSDRQPAGLFEVGEPGSPPVSISPGWAFASGDHGEVRHQLLLTAAGDPVVVSCAAERCQVRGMLSSTDQLRLLATDVPDRDVYGIAGDRLIMGSSCTPACPTTAIDLVDGAAEPSAQYCQSAALITSDDGPVVASDVASDGTCPSSGYAVRATDLQTGRTSQPYRSEDPKLQLVPRPGWELPRGWLLLGADGVLSIARGGTGLAVNVEDGARQSLPVQKGPDPSPATP